MPEAEYQPEDGRSDSNEEVEMEQEGIEYEDEVETEKEVGHQAEGDQPDPVAPESEPGAELAKDSDQDDLSQHSDKPSTQNSDECELKYDQTEISGPTGANVLPSRASQTSPPPPPLSPPPARTWPA